MDKNEPADMFSPSVAQLATSSARDWSYVESWLAVHFPALRVPPFERTPATLKVLLTMASVNEAATECGYLRRCADSDALKKTYQNAAAPASSIGSRHVLRSEILEAIESELSREGRSSLESLATTTVTAGLSTPEIDTLAGVLVGTQADAYDVEQMIDRIRAFDCQLSAEITKVGKILSSSQKAAHSAAAKLTKGNIELQRKVKALSVHTSRSESTARDQPLSVASLETQPTTIHDILLEEQEYIALVRQKRQLDSRIASFRGLPSNPRLARGELKALQHELDDITSQRDEVFQGLVQRTSPGQKR